MAGRSCKIAWIGFVAVARFASAAAITSPLHPRTASEMIQAGSIRPAVPTCPPLVSVNDWGTVLIRTLQIGATIAVGIMTLFCAGCIITPGSSPLGADVQEGQGKQRAGRAPLCAGQLTPEVVNILGQHVPRLSTAFAAQTPPKAFRFGIGDVVCVTIFLRPQRGSFYV